SSTSPHSTLPFQRFGTRGTRPSDFDRESTVGFGGCLERCFIHRHAFPNIFFQFSRHFFAVSNSEYRLPSCSIRKNSRPPTDSAAAISSFHGVTPSPNRTR